MRLSLSAFSAVCMLLGASGGLAQDGGESPSLFEMSLQELMDVRLHPSASLTAIGKRATPAAVTTITRGQIENSGARNLDELLDIYVPGFQYLTKNNSDVIGLRGIISDRNGKMMLLVNGKVMNTRGNGGVISERMLSMLADIDYIEVVRGSGSAIYGAGAIAGVINIVTLTGLTFEGTDVQVRGGVGEQFGNLEIRHGLRFNDASGVFLYYGIDQYDGADADEAPLYFSSAFETFNGVQVEALEETPFPLPGYHEAYRGQPRHKLHLEYDNGGFDIWARYTRGGVNATEAQNLYMSNDTDLFLNEGQGYQQLTLVASYEQAVSDTLKFLYRVGYDLNDWERNMPTSVPVTSAREDEYYGRFSLLWNPVRQHKIAIGTEYSHEIFGLRSPGYPHTPPRYNGRLPSGGEALEDWHTDSYAFFGEYQWNISSRWALLLGGRGDKHTYTEWLYSPRAAVVHVLSEKDVLKLLGSRSVRRADDADIRTLVLLNDTEGETESIDSYELRYERQQSRALMFAASTYYGDYDIIGWTFSQDRSTTLGTLEFYGVEAEMTYHGERARATFSHNFTQQIGFELDDESVAKQNVSASAYGYGNDLANWSDHVTKLTAEYDMTRRWTGSTSLRVLWGYPGGQDLADYNRAQLGNDRNLPSTDGATKAWDQSVYLNLGLRCTITTDTTVRLDAHNVLGLLDEDLNKRNDFQRTSKWRNEAPALSVSLRHAF